MNDMIFQIGNFGIKWYSVLILVGAILAIVIILKEAKRFDYPQDMVFNLLFWGIIFGIIGARLYYVAFNYKLYNNFVDIFKIWEGGLAIHGGIIFGLATAAIYAAKYKVRLIRLLDFIVPGVILAQAIGRWGNFFNSEAHGVATTLAHLKSLHIPDFVINGMNIGGIYYQPTFFYESLWCILGFLIIIIFRRFKYTKIGQPTAFYFIWYGIGRFFIEALRTDSLMFGGFKVAQIVSIGLIVVGLIILINTFKKGRFEDLYNKDREEQIRF